MQISSRPSVLRCAIGTTALYFVRIPLIVLGMLLMLIDEVEHRFGKQRAP